MVRARARARVAERGVLLEVLVGVRVTSRGRGKP